MKVAPVRRAYEQIADQLRGLILEGALRPGQRLPTEAELSERFGASRATVREALRVLATQNLVRTTKGATGGSFVIVPTADHISEFLTSSIGLLANAETVSLDELLELREMLEVPAARLAARNRSAEDVDALRAAIPGQPRTVGDRDVFRYGHDFHSRVVLASGNSLLRIAVEPLNVVVETRLNPSRMDKPFRAHVADDHRAIADAIAAGDEDAAADQMRRHLAYLRPTFELAWRDAAPVGRSSQRS